MHFSVQAKPNSITIDSEQTALIIVDMQNEFASKGGLFDRLGIDISAIQSAAGAVVQSQSVC